MSYRTHLHLGSHSASTTSNSTSTSIAPRTGVHMKWTFLSMASSTHPIKEAAKGYGTRSDKNRANPGFGESRQEEREIFGSKLDEKEA